MVASKKKIIRKSRSKVVNRIRKKSCSTLNTLTRHGYSLKKKSGERLDVLKQYTNKFGIRKTISQLSKLLSRYFMDNKVIKILIRDVKNLQKWLTSSIKQGLKGGGEKATSPVLEQLKDFSLKLKKQVEKLAKKSKKSFSGITSTMSSQKHKMDEALSIQVNKMKKMSTTISTKSKNLESKVMKLKHPKTNQNQLKTNQNQNKNKFNNTKCKLCMEHCTPNGKVKQNNNNNNNNNNNKNKNKPTSPIEVGAKLTINNQSSKSRSTNNRSKRPTNNGNNRTHN
jgi:hypothetical protein